MPHLKHSVDEDWLAPPPRCNAGLHIQKGSNHNELTNRSWSGYVRVTTCLIVCLVVVVLIHSNSHGDTPPLACKRKRTASERPMCPAICRGVQPAKTHQPRTSRMARAWRVARSGLQCPRPRGAESTSRPRPQTTAKAKTTHTTRTGTPRKPLAENQIDRQHEELWCLGVAPTALDTMDAPSCYLSIPREQKVQARFRWHREHRALPLGV